MTREPQPGRRAGAGDDGVVPAVEVMLAVARARRALSRSRRLPGLSLFFLGGARGLVKVVSPHVPALPWGVTLSPTLLWEWNARGGRAERPLVAPSPMAAALASSAPAAMPRAVPAPFSSTPAGPPPAEPSFAMGETPKPPPQASSVPSRALPGAAGLEAVAPALVLVHRVRGAPFRGAHSEGGTAPGPISPSAARRRLGNPSFGWDLGAARPAQSRIEGSPPGAVHAAPTPGLTARALTEERSAEGPARSLVAGARPGLEPEADGGVLERGGFAPVAAALPWSLPTATISPTHPQAAPSPERAEPASIAPEPPVPLLWAAPTPGSWGPLHRAPLGAAGDRRAFAMGEPPKPPPHASGEAAPARELVSWGAPAIVWPAGSRSVDALPEDAPARLLQREPRAAPAAMKDLVEVAESLRSFVTREVGAAKQAGASAASRRPEPLRPPSAAQEEATARRLLSRMRTMIQEERFRSGKLR